MPTGTIICEVKGDRYPVLSHKDSSEPVSITTWGDYVLKGVEAEHALLRKDLLRR